MIEFCHAGVLVEAARGVPSSACCAWTGTQSEGELASPGQYPETCLTCCDPRPSLTACPFVCRPVTTRRRPASTTRRPRTRTTRPTTGPPTTTGAAPRPVGLLLLPQPVNDDTFRVWVLVVWSGGGAGVPAVRGPGSCGDGVASVSPGAARGHTLFLAGRGYIGV